MFKLPALSTTFALALSAGAGPSTCLAQSGSRDDTLVGAWRGNVQFTSGAFAQVKGLDFLYAFPQAGR